MEADGKRIKRITGGGSILCGEAIRFDVEFDDHVNESFQCPIENLPKVIDALRAFGQMAQNSRAGRPAGTSLESIVQPYRSRKPPRIGTSADGTNIAVQFDTNEGIPVTIAMPKEQAEDLAKRIAAEVALRQKRNARH